MIVSDLQPHSRFPVPIFPLFEVASNNCVCASRQLGMCLARAEYVNRGMLSPIAYGLRPITSSSFFRLETPFSPFLVLLYHIINQLLIYPFYTNRPRFV